RPARSRGAVAAKKGRATARSTKCTAPASSAPGVLSSDGMICFAKARIARASALVRCSNDLPFRASSRAHAANDASRGSCSVSHPPATNRVESVKKARRARWVSLMREKRILIPKPVTPSSSTISRTAIAFQWHMRRARGEAVRSAFRVCARLCGAGVVAATVACDRSSSDPSKSTFATVAAGVAKAAAAVTGQDAPIATAYEKGRYVGFDTHTYPGTLVMETWKKSPGAPYSWVG